MVTDSKFVEPVVKTVMSVFATMIQMQPEVGSPYLKHNDIAKGEVTGMLKMEGDTANGSVSITFTKPVVVGLVKRLLHMDITEIDEFARDMTGEMANIVVGGAKNLLEEQGYSINMSLPEIFVGDGHQIQHHFAGETIEIPFHIESGDFYVEVNFKE